MTTQVKTQESCVSHITVEGDPRQFVSIQPLPQGATVTLEDFALITQGDHVGLRHLAVLLRGVANVKDSTTLVSHIAKRDLGAPMKLVDLPQVSCHPTPLLRCSSAPIAFVPEIIRRVRPDLVIGADMPPVDDDRPQPIQTVDEAATSVCDDLKASAEELGASVLKYAELVAADGNSPEWINPGPVLAKLKLHDEILTRVVSVVGGDS